MKKLFTLLALLLLFMTEAGAQVYQSTPNKMWGRWCYREQNGKALDAYEHPATMTSMPNSSDIVLAYYYRIPAGHVRADVIWQNTYLRKAVVKVRVIYPQTGQVLKETQFTNDDIMSNKELTTDLFGDINFPADDFYRIELSCDNWSYVRAINYFNYYHESELPVLIPRNFGGTSTYLSTWGSTDPEAPAGEAYDWAYVELRCEKDRQYPGTYYMAIGALSGYMGMQTVGWNSEAGDYDRSVLFSVWDAANGDEMKVPEHMQSQILDGNLQAVHTHAGGEGSSASVMFQNNPIWWKDGHWVSFLLNTRPTTRKVTLKARDGSDSTFNYPYTLMSVWYKLDTMPDWRYMATIRAAGRAENLSAWHDFVEPFTSYAGQKVHTVYHRHAAMRSANSGRWYSRNKVTLGNETYGRDFHYDFGRGATQKYENCFFKDMGGYVHQHDSATIVPLAADMSFVDTINLDRLNKVVDKAMARDDYYNLEARVHQTAYQIPQARWKVIDDLTSAYSSADNVVDGNPDTKWRASSPINYLALESDADQTISSIGVYWTDQYNYRCHFMDVYTSEDGKNWNLQFDSLEIRCLDSVEVSLPHPITTKYLRFAFYYKYTRSNSLNINELTFRGAYQLDSVKALAKTLIDEAGTINNYSTEDLRDVISIYDNGNCQDAQALADALSAVSANGTFMRNYLVTKALHFAKDHNYVFVNASGYGTLGADSILKQLSVGGATIDGALPQYSGKAELTNPYNNWLIMHDERYSGYYLYNVAAKKFFNPEAEGKLSTEPATVLLRPWGRSFYIASADAKQVYGVDGTAEDFFSVSAAANNKSFFNIYDNMAYQTPNNEVDSLKVLTDSIGKFALYKSSIQGMLDAPVGVVGGFTSEDARAALQAAYDNADTNPQAFINAVENADVIELDPEHTLYRLKSTDGEFTETPFLTADAGLRLYSRSESNGPAQIWRLTKKNDGYRVSSQGVAIKPLSENPSEVVITTASMAQSGTIAFSEKSWGKFWLGAAEYAPAVVNATDSPIKTSSPNNNGDTWYIEPATNASITLNSSGVGSTYYDYGYIAPAGLEVYAVDSVTSAGVLKLHQLNDTVPPRTPVILRGNPYDKFNVQIFGGNDTLAMHNLLRGVFFRNQSLQRGTFMTLGTTNGQPVMKKPALPVVNANQVYLPLTDDMPNLSTYTIDFDNVIDGINDAHTATADDANAPTYTIDGRRATNTVKGNIYIRNHRKVLAK